MCAFGEYVPFGQWAKPTHFAKQHIDRKVITFCEAAHYKNFTFYFALFYIFVTLKCKIFCFRHD